MIGVPAGGTGGSIREVERQGIKCREKHLPHRRELRGEDR
jgi:hypothetical protein